MGFARASGLYVPLTLKKERRAPPPPPTTPREKTYGSYCIKVSVDMVEEQSLCKVGTITAFDTSMDIVGFVEKACRDNTRQRGWKCMPSVVAFCSKKPCEGVFFVFEKDKVKKMV